MFKVIERHIIVGDRVRVKSWKKLVETAKKQGGRVDIGGDILLSQGGVWFTQGMKRFCGMGGIVTMIVSGIHGDDFVHLDNPHFKRSIYHFSRSMFEPWEA